MNLVTGATGFIGTHLVQRLVRDGEPTRVLCRPGSEPKLPPLPVEIAHGDLRDRDSLVRAASGVTRIFHCGGRVSDWGAHDTFDAINVRGTQWLLEAAAVHRVRRFVHVSSIAAFGTPSPRYFDDDTPVVASKDGYSHSKALGEQLALAFHRDRGVPVTIVRPAVVYGPSGTWLEQPLSMIERDKLFLLGGGKGTCHPCYVENLVDAMVLAAEHPAAIGEAFIVSDGESVSFREYFDAVASIAGRPPIRRSIPYPVAVGVAAALELSARARRSQQRPLLTRTAIAMVTTRSEMSATKITRVLGYRPRYTFPAAIDHLRAWYASRR